MSEENKIQDNTFDKSDATVDTDIVKCESCGSVMTFDPDTQDLVCGHCGRKESFEKNNNVQEIELSEALKVKETWGTETSISRCENCGGEVVLEKKVVATECPFCGTSHVVLTKEIAGIKPNAVIPFLVGEEKAAESCKKWSKRRVFAPSKFKKSFSPQNIKGVYTPCFTFDSNTASVYSGRLGQRRTRTVGSGKNRRTETYTHWFRVSGSFQKFFDDILIAAGKNITQKVVNKVSPFAKEKGCVYENKFLHGFMANHYSKDINSSWGEAKRLMDAEIRRQILRKHNADVVDYLNISTNHHNVTYKYVLMPVYVGNYTFHKKVYNIYVNGSTAKVYGKAPVSPLRVGILVAIILALFAGLALLVMKGSADEVSYIEPPVVQAQTVQADVDSGQKLEFRL